MKSSLRSDEIFSLRLQMKLNPPPLTLRSKISSRSDFIHDSGFIPAKADLVEKTEQVFDLLYFFKSVLTKKKRSSKIIVYVKLRRAVRKIKRLARLDVG